MPSIIRATTSSGLQIAPDNSGSLQLQTNGTTTAVTIDTSQNVGIGTTSPTYKFQVSNTNGDTQVGVYDLSSSSSAARLDIRTSGTGASQWFIQTGNTASGLNGALRFYDQSVTTERMRIDSSGRILTTGTVNNDNVFSITNSNATPSGLGITFSGAAPNNTTQYAIQFGDSASYRFRVYSNGNVVNSNNSYGSISDVKLKENIIDATPKLDKLMDVKVRNYNLIGETTKQIGVVAQELEAVFPSMIDESPDLDKEGKDLGTTTKSVKYSVFVPMLIKAIQEQQTIINDLKARVETLEVK